MDTCSAASTGAAAQLLGTSIPRLKRAISKLQAPVERNGAGRVRVRTEDLPLLLSHLGRAPQVPGLSREDLFVLAALSRHPLGLASARAVSRASSTSPTTASRSLRRLEELGAVECVARKVIEGKAVERKVWGITWTEASWQEIADSVRQVVLPTKPAAVTRPRRVPRRLHHLFWNTDPHKIDLSVDARYVAGRILGSNDTQALSWMARNIEPESILAAATMRGTSPAIRRLAEHIAASR